MKLKLKTDSCGYCGACVSVCPENVLSLDEWQLNIGPAVLNVKIVYLSAP